MGRLIRRAMIVAWLAATLGGAWAAMEPLLQEDFERDPLETGWEVTLKEGAKAGPEWTPHLSRSGRHCLLAQGGRWRSPQFPVEPFGWYRVEFWSQASAPEYWALFCQDAEGNDLAADHYSGVDPSLEWRREVAYVRGRAGARQGRVIFQQISQHPLYVDDVRVTRATREEAERWRQELAGQMPEVRFTPPPGRWEYLPQTRRRLEQGERLRVVMLGDSIVNDTGNSPWDLVVEQQYPGARVEVVIAVRGGGGCWYYQEEGRVEEYVLAHEPDLLIIGGISHRSEVEAIRSVIRQTREKSEAEILVMTDAVGPHTDPRSNPEWTAEVDPQGEGYRSALGRMAQEERVAYFDFTGPWGEYVRDSRRPYFWFLRDPVHANERGRSVLARILGGWFAPEE